MLDVFGPHVEYLGLTPAEIADATTTTNDLLTYVDIPDNFNNADAWLSAVFEHGAAGSGLLESVLSISGTVSHQLVLTCVVGAPSSAASTTGRRCEIERTEENT